MRVAAHPAAGRAARLPARQRRPLHRGARAGAGCRTRPRGVAGAGALGRSPGDGLAGVSSVPSGERPVSLGFALSLLPVGTLTTSTQGTTANTDADVTALRSVRRRGGRPLAGGGLLTPVRLQGKSPAAAQSSTEYDLRARLTVFDPLASDRRLYARLSPGYSILSPPSGTWPPGVSNRWVRDGCVGRRRVAVRTGREADRRIGYQIGFQGTSMNGQDVDLRTRFLHVGFGFALGL